MVGQTLCVHIGTELMQKANPNLGNTLVSTLIISDVQFVWKKCTIVSGPGDGVCPKNPPETLASRVERENRLG